MRIFLVVGMMYRVGSQGVRWGHIADVPVREGKAEKYASGVPVLGAAEQNLMGRNRAWGGWAWEPGLQGGHGPCVGRPAPQ